MSKFIIGVEIEAERITFTDLSRILKEAIESGQAKIVSAEVVEPEFDKLCNSLTSQAEFDE